LAVVTEAVQLRMRDGVRLATDVYVPAGAGRFPVVLSRGPYGRREPVTCQAAIAAVLVDAGYAVVMQDTRGKYGSEGEARPFAPTEVADAAETLDWIAAQPWSADAVVMVGDSYYGWLQWAAAATSHRLLRGIVPGMTSTRVADDWMYHNNAFCLATMGEWAVAAWTKDTNNFRDLDWAGRPLGELVASWTAGTGGAEAFAAWRDHGPGDAFWRGEPFATVGPDRAGVAALHLGGWWDTFRAGQLRDWRAASRGASMPQHLAMGGLDHHYVELREDPWSVAPAEDEHDFATRYVAMILPFLEQVTSRDSGAAIPPVRYEVAFGDAHVAATWPPPGLRSDTLHLVDGGRALLDAHGGGLSPRAERLARRVRWTHDPARLVPSGELDAFAMLVQPADEAPVQARDDVLTFSTPPLERPLELVGESRLRLRADAAGAGRQFVAKLSDVFLDGRALRITEGVRTVAAGEPDDTVLLPLLPCAYRVRAGHSLRLEVAASHFPHYLPGAPVDAWTDLGGPLPYALVGGGADGSRLELSVAR
jgi:putative CocE/NonD family hydrolase